ncbi:hypothetical protein CMO89_03140 [Candidatus Woesearchaeota archaeon]|nr:hypothetical protein [Candidatus Woesearchaeota archaeon]
MSTFSYAASIKCNDDGSILITGVSGKSKGLVSARKKSSKDPYFKVDGTWTEYEDNKFRFRSEEALFVSSKPTRYTVVIGRRKSTAKCPAFKFSCRIFNMSVDYCYKRNDTFYAKFTANNFKIDKDNSLRFNQPYTLRYDAETKEKKTYTHAPDILSKEFNETDMVVRQFKTKNRFIMSWETPLNVSRFIVSYDGCERAKYNLRERANCIEMPSCDRNEDCFTDEICEEGTCSKSECDECQYPMNNTCYDYECCESSVCKEDEECSENKCISLECKEDEQLVEHECISLECEDDEYLGEHECIKLECKEDEFAFEHECVKLECYENEQILDHECVELECEDNEFTEGNECKPLKCGFLKKAYKGKCFGWFSYLGKIFKKG